MKSIRVSVTDSETNHHRPRGAHIEEDAHALARPRWRAAFRIRGRKVEGLPNETVPSRPMPATRNPLSEVSARAELEVIRCRGPFAADDREAVDPRPAIPG